MTDLALRCTVRRGWEGRVRVRRSDAAASPPFPRQELSNPFLRFAGFPSQYEKGRSAMDMEWIAEISTRCSKLD